MKRKFNLDVEIPEGIECVFGMTENNLKCKKGDLETEKVILIPGTVVKIVDKKININCEKANKKTIAIIKSVSAHIKNIFEGLSEKFVYELEICFVHFPMTVKVEGQKITISNFLGEKINRTANILSGVDVKIKGQKVTVTGHDIEKTGQTAANIENATRVPKKDKRIFQDGIFMTSKPGGKL